MATDLVIRVATADDLEAIVRVVNAAFVVERWFVDRDRVDLPGVRELLSRGTFLVGEETPGDPVAGAYLERRGDRGYFGLLSVAPDRKRLGYGRQMVNAIEAHFRQLGCHVVDIRVVNLRTELPPIYRRLGYVEHGTEPFEDPKLLMACHFILMSKAL
jgi:GNAT superfamily N-acetyltransferase